MDVEITRDGLKLQGRKSSRRENSSIDYLSWFWRGFRI